MEKKLQKLYLTEYNLLIMQDLWKSHYQVFLIISLIEFIEFNATISMTIQNVKRLELNSKTVSAVLNTWELKMINKIQMFMLR